MSIQQFHAMIARNSVASGGSYDYEESFDTNPGYDLAGWTESGASGPDEDASAPTGMSGLSLLCDTNNARAALSVTANSVYHVYMLFRWTAGSMTDGNEFIAFRDSGGTTMAAVRGRAAGGDRIQIINTGGSTVNGTVGTHDLVVNTTYHIWADFTTGSGSDATINAYIATSGTKPTADVLTSSNGTSTNNVEDIRIGKSGNVSTVYYDDFKADTSSIGDQ